MMYPFNIALLALFVSTAAPALAGRKFARDDAGIAVRDTTDHATIVSRSENSFSPDTSLLFRRNENNIPRSVLSTRDIIDQADKTDHNVRQKAGQFFGNVDHAGNDFGGGVQKSVHDIFHR
ncbi:hypothetical protein F5148DRAFT_355239 [Russula earlei]|uniref:Uncharacterized protein n=1 Tax=Russula earlei TaxID=71964 RepID=A0ACC0U100_9AGAM|nr:hypothetical protein F5148DRAFT_355239 [Russula earlei]